MSKNDFFQRVYKVVRTIPVGRVTTYGLIAKKLGSWLIGSDKNF